jgi:fructose-1,6-bisphosphatase/inositol monophosphatase family enzyme
MRETYAALAGAGATLNGRPLRVDPSASLASANTPKPILAEAREADGSTRRGRPLRVAPAPASAA